jgi:hypothetical protein
LKITFSRIRRIIKSRTDRLTTDIGQAGTVSQSTFPVYGDCDRDKHALYHGGKFDGEIRRKKSFDAGYVTYNRDTGFNIWGNSNKRPAFGKLERTQELLLHSGGILLRNPIHACTGIIQEELSTVCIFCKVSDRAQWLPCSESIQYEKHAHYSITQPYCRYMNGYTRFFKNPPIRNIF